MQGVAVTKSLPVVVRPSESETVTPPPSDTVPLSSFDRRMPPISVTSLLVFDRTIDKPVETVKLALSRALAHYRPIAGRLDGDGGIACTDEGVTFVGAAASCALKDATATAALRQMDLALSYPGLLCRDEEPLLLVQVTEFTCGGFIIGVTSNHVAADGAGMAQFLQAVGELARGISPPSCFPVRSWDEQVMGLPSSTIAAEKSSIIEQERQQHLVSLDIVIPSGLISRIRAGEFGGGEGEPRPCCTVLDAVMAVLWRCRTRATTSPGDADSRAPLKFACNMRTLAGAPAGYYGNCVRVQVVPATAGEVANGGVGHLVGLIRRAKEKVPDLLSTSAGNGAEAGQGQRQRQAPLWYEAFTVTDWRNLGLGAVDLGGGPPARVLLRPARREIVPGCVVYPPRRERRRQEQDGVEVSSTFVMPEHVDAFLGELATLAASSPE